MPYFNAFAMISDKAEINNSPVKSVSTAASSTRHKNYKKPLNKKFLTFQILPDSHEKTPRTFHHFTKKYSNELGPENDDFTDAFNSVLEKNKRLVQAYSYGQFGLGFSHFSNLEKLRKAGDLLMGVYFSEYKDALLEENIPLQVTFNQFKASNFCNLEEAYDYLAQNANHLAAIETLEEGKVKSEGGLLRRQFHKVKISEEGTPLSHSCEFFFVGEGSHKKPVVCPLLSAEDGTSDPLSAEYGLFGGQCKTVHLCVELNIKDEKNHTFNVVAVSRPILGEDARLFEQEYEFVRKINGPGIVKPADLLNMAVFSDSDGSQIIQPVALQPFYQEGTLETYIRNPRSNSIPLNPIWPEIIVNALRGLELIHHMGFVHRDIKPANLFMRRSGKHLFAEIADFGYMVKAHQIESVKGTPAFLGPDAFRHGISGPADPKVDIASLGLTFLYMIKGHDAYKKLPTAIAEVIEHDTKGNTKIRQFSVKDLNAIHKEIIETELSQDPTQLSHIFHLIAWMIHPNPDDRPTAFDALTRALAIFGDL